MDEINLRALVANWAAERQSWPQDEYIILSMLCGVKLRQVDAVIIYVQSFCLQSVYFRLSSYNIVLTVWTTRRYRSRGVYVENGLEPGSLIFPTSSPFTFIWESMPGIIHNYRNINSDDFGGHLVLRLENQERNIRTKDRHVTGLEIAKILYHLL